MPLEVQASNEVKEVGEERTLVLSADALGSTNKSNQGIFKRSNSALQECRWPEDMVICGNSDGGPNSVCSCHDLMSLIWMIDRNTSNIRVNGSADSSRKCMLPVTHGTDNELSRIIGED